MNKMNLPLYELKINPDEDMDVFAISLVSEGAVESSFFAFNKAEIKVQYFSNDEKKEIMGIAMIPDKPIYRKDNNGEYLVTFTKETIREIAQNFAKKGYMNNTNLEHSDIEANSIVYQSYIVDSSIGMNAPKVLEKDAVDGSWIVGMKINDPITWGLVKKGLVNDFSIEGWFNQLYKENIDFKFSKDLPKKGQLLSTLNDLESLLGDN